MNDSAIMCAKIIESYNKEAKTVPINFNEKKYVENKKTCRKQKFCILLAFLFTTIAFYFDDIRMGVININFHNVLLDEKTSKDLLIYNSSYKTFMGEKLLCIWFNRIDGFIKIDNGIKFFVLLEYNKIYGRIKYFINEKSGITGSINHHFARIRIDSYNYLHIEKY